jgi:hypothetical protein
MQNAAGVGVAQAPYDPNDAYHAVVSDLVSLVEHVQNSLRLIEQMIAKEVSPGAAESSTNVIVLDDVSPCYTKAAAAVQARDFNMALPCTPCWIPAMMIHTPPACRRFRS